MAMPDVSVDWLLDADPTLRWQVERDVVGAPSAVWEATRARTTVEGHGARLLALQDHDGQWAGGAFFPAGFVDSGGDGQPWTATTWSLTTLREWGVDAEPLRRRGTAELLASNARWEYDELPYWGGEVDACINAMTLANGQWLGADVAALVDWFAEHQLADGGWNCEWVEGAQRSSFHSTLNSLRGLLSYEIATGDIRVASIRRAGEEYLLSRNLFRRASTGEVVGPWATRFVYPARWVYSVLGAADHLRMAASVDGVGPDPRMADAIALIRAARRDDGTWLQGGRHPGAVWFETDVPPGEPSRWLTLIGTRVLAWWDDHHR